MTCIDDQELRSVLASPSELYQAITSWSHYRPQTAKAPGDCELIPTNMTWSGCIVFATVNHARREAFLSLLSAEDATAMRAALAERTAELPSAIFGDTASRRRPTRF